jgi:insertion element IS1 protein InsB
VVTGFFRSGHWRDAKADEKWSFVGKKRNEPWIWIAMDTKTRQIIPLYVGNLRCDNAKELWGNIPVKY